jgi:hypothetical protein
VAAAATDHASRARARRRDETTAGTPAWELDSPIHCSCPATSDALCHRSSGSFSRHLRTTWRPDKPIFLTVKRDLTLALGEQPIGREALASGLNALTMGDKETRIFLRADQEVAYGPLMEVMNLMRKAGYLKIALVGLEKPPPQ